MKIFCKEVSIKDILISILIFSIFSIISSGYVYGAKETAKLTQSFGIGLGSLFAGLAGLTAFLDWFDKSKRMERYIKEFKEKYPRKLLGEGKLKLVGRENSSMIYLLDKRDNKLVKRWFQDQEARSDLGFSSSDTSEIMSDEDLSKYTEEDPILPKKNY